VGAWSLALANSEQPKVIINFVGLLSQTVSASGLPALSNQWYFGPNALAGATNQFLVTVYWPLTMTGAGRFVVHAGCLVLLKRTDAVRTLGKICPPGIAEIRPTIRKVVGADCSPRPGGQILNGFNYDLGICGP